MSAPKGDIVMCLETHQLMIDEVPAGDIDGDVIRCARCPVVGIDNLTEIICAAYSRPHGGVRILTSSEMEREIKRDAFERLERFRRG